MAEFANGEKVHFLSPEKLWIKDANKLFIHSGNVAIEGTLIGHRSGETSKEIGDSTTIAVQQFATIQLAKPGAVILME